MHIHDNRKAHELPCLIIDAKRAFQKMVVEKQELKQENAMLRQAYATLVAECDERRVAWTEQGPGRAREELLRREIQSIKVRNKECHNQNLH